MRPDDWNAWAPSWPLKVVCAHCATTNRLLASKLNDQPICGRCHRPLFFGTPIHVDTASFDVHIGQSDIPVLVEFAAASADQGSLHQVATALEPAARLAMVNAESNVELVTRFAVTSSPTFIVFWKGREIGRRVGAIPPVSSLVSWVRSSVFEQ